MENTNTGREQGKTTGTRDVTYDLTAVLYHALQGVENCQIYAGDAQGKNEHRQFFEQAMQAQRQLAEQAKTLLHDCLMQEVQHGSQGDRSTSAFGQQGMSAGGGNIGGGMAGEIGSTQTHSYSEARDDGSTQRFASGQTEGGSDQFEGAGGADRQDVGRDQRQDGMTTGDGSASRF
jgi:hypothetical protein